MDLAKFLVLIVRIIMHKEKKILAFGFLMLYKLCINKENESLNSLINKDEKTIPPLLLKILFTNLKGEPKKTVSR